MPFNNRFLEEAFFALHILPSIVVKMPDNKVDIIEVREVNHEHEIEETLDVEREDETDNEGEEIGRCRYVTFAVDIICKSNFHFH